MKFARLLAHGARLLAELMERLVCDSYAMADGARDAIINRHLASHHLERLIGLHSNMILAGPPTDEGQRNRADPEELAFTSALADCMRNQNGHQMIQSTKPQILDYGLADSPAGAAGLGRSRLRPAPLDRYAPRWPFRRARTTRTLSQRLAGILPDLALKPGIAEGENHDD